MIKKPRIQVILVKKDQEDFQNGFGIFWKKNFPSILFTQNFYIKLWRYCGQDLFGSQIPVTTGGFEL